MDDNDTVMRHVMDATVPLLTRMTPLDLLLVGVCPALPCSKEKAEARVRADSASCLLPRTANPNTTPEAAANSITFYNFLARVSYDMYYYYSPLILCQPPLKKLYHPTPKQHGAFRITPVIHPPIDFIHS